MTKRERRKKAALDAIEACGGPVKLAQHLRKAMRCKLTSQAVSNWATRGSIPMKYVERIADIAGLLPSDVDPYVPVVIMEDAGPVHDDPSEPPDPDPAQQEPRSRRKREPVPVLAEPTGAEPLPDFVSVSVSDEEE